MKTWEDFYYCERSPSCLKWRTDRRSGVHGATITKRAYSNAGTLSKQGYWVTRLNKRRVFAHRIVWRMHYGDIPEGHYVDHIDGCSTNNRIENLRLVTKAGNGRNVKLTAKNTSGTCGVGLQKKSTPQESWVAQWRDLDGKKRSKWFSVGRYGSDAALAMAVKVREQAIKDLNKCGAGYTDRHGKGEQH